MCLTRQQLFGKAIQVMKYSGYIQNLLLAMMVLDFYIEINHIDWYLALAKIHDNLLKFKLKNLDAAGAAEGVMITKVCQLSANQKWWFTLLC